MRSLQPAWTLLAVLAAHPPALAQEVRRLDPGDLLAGDRFGSAVVLDGDLAFVAAPRKGPADQQGVAYALELDTGVVRQTYVPVGGAFEAGVTLAVGGNLVLLGDPLREPGRVQVFDRATGQQLWELTSPNAGTAPDRFGAGLATDGQTIWVGAPRDLTTLGRVYAFDASTGQVTHQLMAQAPTFAYQGFGQSLDLWGTQLVVGVTPRLESPNNALGRVQVFDTASYGLQLDLLPPDGHLQDLFGLCLRVDGDHLLVGAPGYSAQAQRAGKAYHYDLTSGTLLGELLPPLPQLQGHFGQALDLHSGSAAVGQRHGDGAGPDSGQVTVFHLATGLPQGRFLASDTSSADQLGFSVALDQGLVLAGAPLDDGLGINAGAAYLFDLDGQLPAEVLCADGGCPCANDDPGAGCANATGQGAVLQAWGTSSVAFDDLSFSSQRLPPNQFSLLFMGDAQASSPLANGLLCVAGSLYRFGGAVQADGAGTVEHGSNKAFYSSIFFGPAGTITAGSTWFFQTWYRDPAGPCGATSNTTNGLRVTFTP